MNKYDYIIVGAGPTGLTMAWYLSSRLGKRVLIIDRENSIGGCHRVMRVNNLFSEHGPRIYLNNFINFMKLLNDMGLDFYTMFTKYKFNVSDIGNKSIQNFTIRELFVITVFYLKYIVNPEESRITTMEEFCLKNNFSKEAMDYLDRLCRLTDGAELSRYTLFTFFELINQNSLYTTYQPVLPNDVGLFREIETKLLNTKLVEILLNTEVVKINEVGGNCKSISVKRHSDTEDLEAERYIMAIPPVALVKILEKSTKPVQNLFGNLNDFVAPLSVKSAYLTYIPITFHWNTDIKLEKKWGFPSTEWGVAYIVLSDYMKFDNPNSKTVISSTITMPDRISSRTGKTPNQSSESELRREVLRQLRISFPNLPEPTVSILAPDIYRSEDGTKWASSDVPFVFTRAGYLKKNANGNIYNVGTHSGNSQYAFTSMEAAVENGVRLLVEIEPRFKYRFKKQFTVNKLLMIIVLIILIFITFKNFT